ncbi:uncharacterized protein LOC111316305 [Durio zibethinus]|uniref:Uncharacterized protein LOC111316305 n=1 Tax=Durio zibethinus TaxID=66656 RepID=A0A6P6BAC0_DURZI|nr:uncharacterized protein LOC111316305 [Durio zibethinus]
MVVMGLNLRKLWISRTETKAADMSSSPPQLGPHHGPFKARNPGYDSLQLVLHWPVSFCNDIRNPHRCGKIPFNYFKIHGLRHCYTQTGRCKVYCGDDGVRLEEYQLPRHLQLKLNREWPDLKIGHSNLNFWRYQWKKHGYCSGKSAQAYFEQAINLSKKYAKLVDILRKYGGMMNFGEEGMMNFEQGRKILDGQPCNSNLSNEQIIEMNYTSLVDNNKGPITKVNFILYGKEELPSTQSLLGDLLVIVRQIIPLHI